MESLTMTQEHLLNEAQDMWSRGFAVPYDLAVQMMGEGLDVSRLEAIHLDN